MNVTFPVRIRHGAIGIFARRRRRKSELRGNGESANVTKIEGAARETGKPRRKEPSGREESGRGTEIEPIEVLVAAVPATAIAIAPVEAVAEVAIM